jgi:hypothetical protein
VKALEKLESKGRVVAALDARPEIFEDLLPAWEAFSVLHAARGNGYSGPQAITIADYVAYVQLVEVESLDDQLEMLRLVQALDGAYMKWWAQRNGAKSHAKSSRGNRRKRSPARG